MIITTSRLVLREFVKDDWQAVHAYHNDPRYLEYYPWFQRSESDTRSFVRGFISWQTEEPRTKFQLAVTVAGGGELIGNCGVRRASVDESVAELGYELAPRYWGRGYATEAAMAMVEFGFGELKLHRIWSSCVLENARSVRVLEKLGMKREGWLRQHQWMKGRWWDTLLYGILEDEWAGEDIGIGLTTTPYSAGPARQ